MRWGAWIYKGLPELGEYIQADAFYDNGDFLRHSFIVAGIKGSKLIACPDTPDNGRGEPRATRWRRVEFPPEMRLVEIPEFSRKEHNIHIKKEVEDA